MGSALLRTGPAPETPPPPPETDPAMGTAMLKTYSEFDNVPGARVYGVLVGEWSWVGCRGERAGVPRDGCWGREQDREAAGVA